MHASFIILSPFATLNLLNGYRDASPKEFLNSSGAVSRMFLRLNALGVETVETRRMKEAIVDPEVKDVFTF